MMYNYHWYQWLAIFYIYCFFGWIFESTYVSLRKHCFINRGFLRVPMLPLYGTGAVMMLWVSLPVRDSLLLVYLFGMLAATALEYVTGAMMERLFKMKYWDYSNQHFQLHGYICLSSSIAWGFLTLFLTEVIHQPVSDFVLGVNQTALFICLFVITAVFTADAYQSTREALALGETLEALTRMKEEMEALEARMAVVREEAAAYAETIRDEAEQRLSDLRENMIDRLITVREETEERISAGRESRKELLDTLELRMAELNEKKRLAFRSRNHLGRFYRAQLLKGNPSASSRFAEALKELKDRLE